MFGYHPAYVPLCQDIHVQRGEEDRVDDVDIEYALLTKNIDALERAILRDEQFAFERVNDMLPLPEIFDERVADRVRAFMGGKFDECAFARRAAAVGNLQAVEWVSGRDKGMFTEALRGCQDTRVIYELCKAGACPDRALIECSRTGRNAKDLAANAVRWGSSTRAIGRAIINMVTLGKLIDQSSENMSLLLDAMNKKDPHFDELLDAVTQSVPCKREENAFAQLVKLINAVRAQSEI
jgi:hypothetical protein